MGTIGCTVDATTGVAMAEFDVAGAAVVKGGRQSAVRHTPVSLYLRSATSMSAKLAKVPSTWTIV